MLLLALKSSQQPSSATVDQQVANFSGVYVRPWTCTERARSRYTDSEASLAGDGGIGAGYDRAFDFLWFPHLQPEFWVGCPLTNSFPSGLAKRPKWETTAKCEFFQTFSAVLRTFLSFFGLFSALTPIRRAEIGDRTVLRLLSLPGAHA